MMSEEVDLVKKDYERNRSLYISGIISKLDLEQKEATYLSQKRNWKQMKSTQIQNDIRIENLRAQKLKLERDFETERNNKIIALQQLCNSYIGDIQKWKQRYLIIAPNEGTLVFWANIKDELALTTGMPLFTILPQKQENNIYAYCEMPITGAGKVVKGSAVHIYLDEYPYKEYGIVEARIEKISAIAQKVGDGYNYNLRLSLPFVDFHPLFTPPLKGKVATNIHKDSILTSYGQAIPFHQNMVGTSSIITEDKRILERILEQLMDLIKN